MKKAAVRAMIILAAVVALSMFFSGTIRTMTTPKVRFISARNGKFEQVLDLTGKVQFPEEEEILLEVSEGTTLNVTSIKVQPGDLVQEGDPLFSATVADLEKTMDELQKEYDTAQASLRKQTRKNGEIRLSRSEQSWLNAYDAAVAADADTRNRRLEMMSQLAAEGLSMEGEALPEKASEALKEAYTAWQTAREKGEEASARLSSLQRFAVSDEIWEDISTRRDLQAKMDESEAKMAELTVLARKFRNYPAPHAGYVTAVSIERGSRMEAGTVLVKMTPEKAEPVLRVDITSVKQSISKGTAVQVLRDSWEEWKSKVTATGVNSDTSRYADVQITQEMIEGFSSIRNMMKNEVKLRITTRAQEATCLVSASAVRGEEKNRYVFVGEEQSSTFGGTQTKVRKMPVTVLNESDTVVSVSEDLTYYKIITQEDRPIDEGASVMAYGGESSDSK